MRQRDELFALAVSLFILMGQLIYHAGLADDVFTLAQRALRRLPGGLGMSTAAASAGFGAVTGSSVAAVATMGNIAVPEMMKRGYTDKLTAALVASAATLAILIPPSVPLVIYGVWSETSIGALFIAGIVPGILLALLFCGALLFQLKRNVRSVDKPSVDRAAAATERHNRLSAHWLSLRSSSQLSAASMQGCSRQPKHPAWVSWRSS